MFLLLILDMIEVTTGNSLAKLYFPNLRAISLTFEYGSLDDEKTKTNCIDWMPFTRAKISNYA